VETQAAAAFRRRYIDFVLDVLRLDGMAAKVAQSAAATTRPRPQRLLIRKALPFVLTRI
jgi:hypothetical protein